MQKDMLIMGGAFLAVLIIIIVIIVVIKKEKFALVEYRPQPVEYKPGGFHGYDYQIMTPFMGCANSTAITPQMMQLPEQTLPPSPQSQLRDPISGYPMDAYLSPRRPVSDFESETMPRY